MRERAKSEASRSSRLLVVVLVVLVMTIFVYLNTPSNYNLSHAGKLTSVVNKHSSHLVRRTITNTYNTTSTSTHNNGEPSLNHSLNSLSSTRMATTTVKINTSKPLNVGKSINDKDKSQTNLTSTQLETGKLNGKIKEVAATKQSSGHTSENVNGDKDAKKQNKTDTTAVFTPSVVSTNARNIDKQITTTEDIITVESDIRNATDSQVDGISVTEEYKVPTPSEIQPAFVRIYKENEFYDRYGLWKDLGTDQNSDDKMKKVIQDSLIQQQEPEKKSRSNIVWPPTLWPATSPDK